jgi:hypothetical protein
MRRNEKKLTTDYTDALIALIESDLTMLLSSSSVNQCHQRHQVVGFLRHAR